MNRLESGSSYNNSSHVDEGLIRQLVKIDGSEATVKELLFKEGHSFSDESILNLVTVLSVYRKIQFPNDYIFFIYGSTARGTAKAGERIQEFQFWKEERFLGSCFRRRGGSDIDVRIITQNRDGLLPSLEMVREDLKKTRSPRIELRIDDPSSVIWEVKRGDTSSFFRRVLALNWPFVLHGRGKLEILTRLACLHLTAEDYANEKQRVELKLLVLRETTEKPFVFMTEKQLRERFPSYYSPLQLLATEPQTPALKISLVSGESSLVTILSDKDIFMDNLRRIPDIPTKELMQ